MNKTDIEKIINDCKESGYEIRVRDISYCLLCDSIEENEIVYNSLFEKCTDMKAISAYDKSKPIKFLKKYINANYPTCTANNAKERKSKPTLDDITFEENKGELIKMLKDIDSAVENGDIEVKDAMKMKVDIRTKLNDKFGATEKTEEQRIVVVPHKCDLICPRTHTECWQWTKEDAMRNFNLIENPNK